MQPKIILASASPRRRELLALLCPNYEVRTSGFDESGVAEGLSPVEHVLTSATAKARDVAPSELDALIIGADTIVVLDNAILGKPADVEDARRMLKLVSGRTHQVITGLCVVGLAAQIATAYETTDVTFRPLSDELIERYIATGEPMDKAGAYAIQGKGAPLIQSIRGDYFNVVGLPLYKLSLLLERFGVEVLAEE